MIKGLDHYLTTPPEVPETELIDMGCPICGERFYLPVDLLEWMAKGGCASCRVSAEMELAK